MINQRRFIHVSIPNAESWKEFSETVLPDNFVDHSLKHYKRGFNEMQKGYDVLTYAPTKNMSQEGRVRYRRVHDRAVTLTAAMKGASVELKTLSSQKKHPMSPENVNR